MTVIRVGDYYLNAERIDYVRLNEKSRLSKKILVWFGSGSGMHLKRDDAADLLAWLEAKKSESQLTRNRVT